MNVMKRMIKALSILSMLVFLSSFNFESSPNTFSLTVEVNHSRNSNGVIQFALYNQDGSIPDEKYKKYYKMLIGSISDGHSTVVFKDLAPGTYVVNILHDENENGKVDKGFILPIEGLGFSNYESIGITNRPKYSKASFELSADMTIEVKVIYM